MNDVEQSRLRAANLLITLRNPPEHDRTKQTLTLDALRAVDAIATYTVASMIETMRASENRQKDSR